MSWLAQDESRLDERYRPDADARTGGDVSRALVFAALLGMVHLRMDAEEGRVSLADPDIASIIPRPVRFEDAERLLAGRVPMTREEFYALDAKMRLRGFTVARLGELDGIERVKRHLSVSLRRGETFSEFWSAADQDEILGAIGFGSSNPWYWETVYRNNVQSAYNAGRAMQVERDADIEYLEFVGIEDVRQTDEICRPRSGTILPKDDPFWQANWPPLHHNCRSTVRAVYPEESRRRGVAPTGAPDTGESPQDGFGGWPLAQESFYRLTPAMRERAQQYGVLGEISSVAGDLGVSGFTVPPADTALFSGIRNPALRALARRDYADSRKSVRSIIDATHARVDRYTYTTHNVGSHYSPRLNEIVISRRHVSQPGVFLHEYGHFLDFRVAGTVSAQRADFVKAFNDDLARIMADTAAGAKRRARLREMLSPTGPWRRDPGVSDLFSAVTNKQIEGHYGHSEDYFSRAGMREFEAYANLFEIRSRRTPGIWTAIRRELPELTKLMEQSVK